jgi:hypothetical protein
MYLYSFKLLLFTFVFIGCTVRLPPHTASQKLSSLLATLDKNISQEEAQVLAQNIYTQVHILSQSFKLTSPPSYHNFLVNIGVKEKGLCYDWADSLYKHLKKQNHASFEFHLMGANIGEYWSEHNVLVISAKNTSLDEAIVIDPWRNSGKIFFSKVKEDKQYQWIHRPKRCKIIGGDKFYP